MYSRSLLMLSLMQFALLCISAQQVRLFSEAKGFGKNASSYEYERWRFTLGKDNYELQKNGIGRRIDSGRRITNFRVKLAKNEELNGPVYFSRFKGDLLFILEVSSGGYGSGQILKLNGSTLKAKWVSYIPAFNITKGLIENSNGYLAGIGFIGKIDLETGKYLWRHDDLYYKYDQSGAFNVFLSPLIVRNTIIFREDDVENRGFDHRIYVNKLTGKIIRVLLK